MMMVTTPPPPDAQHNYNDRDEDLDDRRSVKTDQARHPRIKAEPVLAPMKHYVSGGVEGEEMDTSDDTAGPNGELGEEPRTSLGTYAAQIPYDN